MKPSEISILVIESDPDVSDLIARQTLQAAGYKVHVAADAGAAIKQATQGVPDLIIANLNLSGLSGKDLVVAFASQGINVPFIVVAPKGDEAKVIQAFRVGATDFISWPAKDAEVLAVVERVLGQVGERIERQKLDRQLEQTNAELESRVGELTTILSVGRAVLAVTDPALMYEKIVEAATTVTKASMGWLLVRDEKSKQFLLTASRKLPDGWAKKRGQLFDDGVTGLVALSGETLAINGAPMEQFKASMLGQAILVVPIKVNNQVIGLLAVLRKENKPFGKSEQTLLEGVADYASISMVNTQLFRALSNNEEKTKPEGTDAWRVKLKEQMFKVGYQLELLLSGKVGAFTPGQLQVITAAQTALKNLVTLVESQSPQPDK